MTYRSLAAQIYEARYRREMERAQLEAFGWTPEEIDEFNRQVSAAAAVLPISWEDMRATMLTEALRERMERT